MKRAARNGTCASRDPPCIISGSSDSNSIGRTDMVQPFPIIQSITPPRSCTYRYYFVPAMGAKKCDQRICLSVREHISKKIPNLTKYIRVLPVYRWLGSRVVSMLDSGAEGPVFISQLRRCRVTVLGKMFTPIVPLFTKQRNW